MVIFSWFTEGKLKYQGFNGTDEVCQHSAGAANECTENSGH